MSESLREREEEKSSSGREWLIDPYDCVAVRGQSNTEVITPRSPEFIRVSRREELVQSLFLR